MIVVNITEKVMITVIIVDMGIYSLVSIMKGGKEDMAEKRFGITPELPKGWVDIIDTNDDLTLCNIRIEYADNMIKLLNDLNDENRQLKKENKGVKEVLIDLKKIDSFWDSALLQNHIDKIANILGVDLE